MPPIRVINPIRGTPILLQDPTEFGASMKAPEGKYAESGDL